MKSLLIVPLLAIGTANAGSYDYLIGKKMQLPLCMSYFTDPCYSITAPGKFVIKNIDYQISGVMKAGIVTKLTYGGEK